MITFIKDHIEFFIRPNLPYQDFLQWQDELTQAVLADPNKKYVIICDHPLLLTRGRGDRQNQDLLLESSLPQNIPCIDIKRGGGLTFHAPNQMIVYSIRKMTARYGLNQHLDWLATWTSHWVQKNFDLELEFRRKPLGLWSNTQKVASIGISLSKFVTNHGLALNVQKIPFSQNEFADLNPCGLPATTYSSLENVLNRPLPHWSTFF